MFGGLAENLSRADCEALLGKVFKELQASLRELGALGLAEALDNDIVEQCLCEWFKAKRALRAWQASRASARPLQRRDALGGGTPQGV